jgi:hypothetical protein
MLFLFHYILSPLHRHLFLIFLQYEMVHSSNIFSTVKPASCKISINPFEISTSSNLSSLLFTVSAIFIVDDDDDGVDSDNCELEFFTTIIGWFFSPKNSKQNHLIYS